jgi:thiamine-monophosphate kinase
MGAASIEFFKMIKKTEEGTLLRMLTLGEIGEHETIRRILPMLGNHAELVVGAGDDCAVCRLKGTGMDQVFTTDPVIENVHFQSLEKPERIGHKAVGRVLSDIAAMGAAPQWILVNVVAPASLEIQALEKIYEGMGAICERFGATIIGGDVAKGEKLELHVFGTGLVPADTALLRSGASVGDAVLVTGPLGCSFASGHHLDFIPRVDEGLFLRETGLVGAMMDVSDGLATDLRHILKQSQVGAALEGQAIPRNGSLEQALFDGEDFELVLTSPNPAELQARWAAQFETELPILGKITAEVGVLMLNGQLIESKAFEHFAPERTS